MKVRSKYFVVSGAIGGFVGFILMEVVRRIFPGGGGFLGEVLALGLQFSGFGLAVGASLGMTEGFVQKKKSRMLYGLAVGLLLGAVGGLFGGATGQTIFGLLPAPRVAESARVDISVALDSSGSMRELFFFGSDPRGKRKEAARKLVELLGPEDRVTIVSFNHISQVLLPMTQLDSKAAVKAAKKAIDRVGNSGGTDLNAGLSASIGELVAGIDDGRKQHVIFLTDGVGEYGADTIRPAIENGVTVHTIGLGGGVNRPLLEAIAEPTGGRYYPVGNAEGLWETFETIYKESIGMDMASHQSSGSQGSPNPILVFIFRILSWGAMGFLIGAGQGVRENTREDLKACSLGGLIGGVVGGALFNPISDLIQIGAGFFGRTLADVTVGACIGGSMRMAQMHLVELKSEPTTTLLTILPEKNGLGEMASEDEPGSVEVTERDERPLEGGLKGLVVRMKRAVEGRQGLSPMSAPSSGDCGARPTAAPPPAQDEPRRPEPTGRRRPLSFYQNCYVRNRPKAMAMAFRSGHYSIEDIAEHFGVQEKRVVNAIENHTD